MSELVSTPQPPYYMVVFTSTLKETHPGYHEMAQAMEKLAAEQEGFLGLDTARAEIGITVSYWKDMASIHQWSQNLQHQAAKKKGMEDWYAQHITRIAKVEKQY